MIDWGMERFVLNSMLDSVELLAFGMLGVLVSWALVFRVQLGAWPDVDDYARVLLRMGTGVEEFFLNPNPRPPVRVALDDTNPDPLNPTGDIEQNNE